MRAPYHPRESERLTALGDYGILDTAPDPEFDEITDLVARLCDCPVAMISMIDKDRQWYKSSVGIDMTDTPRDVAICAHTIFADDFTEIPDLSQDVRTSDNPFVTGPPNVRFYAGAILRSSDGLPIGTLCVFGMTPQTLSELQRDTIKVLARQVMVRLDHARDSVRAELMRQEIDHRTKNSLLSIAAMLRIQRRRAIHDETRTALDKSLNQIDTVAALHRELYETGAGNRIDLSGFGTRLCTLLSRTLPEGVRLQSNLPWFTVDSRRAGSFGVMLNEFVTNSAKYAFPNGRTGTIEVTGTMKHNGLHLVLRDDGIGFSGEVIENLGMQVIRAAADDLGSTDTEFQAGSGVRLSLTLPQDFG